MWNAFLSLALDQSPPVKETIRGLGDKQKDAYKETLGKIIYTLCKEGPLTEYQIWNKARIHRTKILGKSLRALLKGNMIYVYVPIPTRNATSQNRVKYTYMYYIANWSNQVTRDLYYWYRNNHHIGDYYITECEDLDHELDRLMIPFITLSDKGSKLLEAAF